MSDAVACPSCFEPEPAVGGYFVSAYPPFDFWTADQLPAFRQVLARPTGDQPLGLYVHVPFCERRCDYCYYLSYQDRPATEIDAYLAGLVQELTLYSRTAAVSGRPFDFVYFGGGTPSLLSRERLGRLFDGLGRSIPNARPREMTFECAPRSVTAEKLQLLRDFGVTRISMGIQQLDDRVLQLNGRPHLVADVERALEEIDAVDFEVLNLDLIVGLVGESDETFFDSLERVLALAPESVTIYQLEIPHNTPLFHQLGDGPIAEPLAAWDEKRRRLEQAFDRLEQDGYSVRSGYTAVREPDRHSFVYQDEQYRGADVIGIGASSFSYLAGVHQQNAASLGSYLAAVGPTELPLGRAYALSPLERFVRECVLQLKLGGIERDDLRSKFDLDPWEQFASQFDELERNGWLERDSVSARLTRSGLLRVDRLLPSFYLPDHGGGLGQPT